MTWRLMLCWLAFNMMILGLVFGCMPREKPVQLQCPEVICLPGTADESKPILP